MAVHRSLREKQPSRDLRVLEPLDEKPEYLELTPRELSRVCLRGRARTAGNLPEHRGSRSRRATIAAAGARTEALQLGERPPECRLVVSAEQGESRLVRAAELVPLLPPLRSNRLRTDAHTVRRTVP